MRNGARCGSAETKAPTPWRVDHQALGAQRRDRLAHHRAADARGARQRLLGRQARAGREAAALDLLGELLEEAPRQLALGGDGADAHLWTAKP